MMTSTITRSSERLFQNEPDRQETFEATIQKEGKFIFVSLLLRPASVGGLNRASLWREQSMASCTRHFRCRRQAYFLRLGAAWLRDSGVAIGDMVTVCLASEGPQVENIAEDIAKALMENKTSKNFLRRPADLLSQELHALD